LLYINGGFMTVDGEFILLNNAMLNMTDKNDYLLVEGNVKIQTTNSLVDCLDSGMLEFKGTDFTIDPSTKVFQAGGIHKLVLSGDTKQTVNFGNDSVHDYFFNEVILTKPNNENNYNFIPTNHTYCNYSSVNERWGVELPYVQWPTESTHITLEFGQVDDIYAGYHRGLDIQGNPGDNVYSAIGGQVVYSGNMDGYGNIVIINSDYNGTKIQTRYAHLADDSITVTAGSSIGQGEIIGSVGNTGTTTGGYVLHFEVLESTNGLDCGLDDSNTINKDPLEYTNPAGGDYQYLLEPFAIGKVPGDTIDFGTTTATTNSATVSSVVYAAGNVSITDENYIKNIVPVNGQVYLRHAVEKMCGGKSKVTLGILSWDDTTKTATVRLENKTMKFGESLNNAQLIGGRLLVNYNLFLDFFYPGWGTDKVKYIHVNSQDRESHKTFSESNLYRSSNGKPLVNLVDVAIAFIVGGNNAAIEHSLDYKMFSAVFWKKGASSTVNERVKLTFNLATKKVTAENLSAENNQVIEVSGIAFSSYKWDFNGETMLRVDPVAIANYLESVITTARLRDGSKVYTITSTAIVEDMSGVYNLASITMDFLPGIGDLKDVQQAVSGVDLITGEKLSGGERAVTVVCTFLPLVNGKTVKYVKKGFIKLSNALTIIGRYGDANTYKKVQRLTNVVEAVDKIEDTLKANPEKVFENIKSVVVNGDEVTITKLDGLKFTDSKSAMKNDLLEEGLNNEAADNAIKCLSDGCFSGDTQVITKSGLKRIDQIQEGEYVLAKDVNNNIIDYREVKRVYIKSTYEFIHLKLEDEEIKTTASHLFFTDSGWWKAARNLKSGDQIVNSKGELKTLLSTSLEELDQPESIYNLNVDEFHTYFVGSQGLLVHNNCSEELTSAIKKYAGKSADEIIAAGKSIVPNKAFTSFDNLKANLGSPGEGNAWHHIVEQCQIKETRAGFATGNIQNTQNIISIPTGSGTIHSQISAHYSSIPPQGFTGGKTVRDWLSTQSFDEQFKYGFEMLQQFGEVVPTSSGWKFIEF